MYSTLCLFLYNNNYYCYYNVQVITIMLTKRYSTTEQMTTGMIAIVLNRATACMTISLALPAPSALSNP